MTANRNSAMCSANSAAAISPVILLVEDEPAVREVTRQVLQHAGYQVLESTNAEEALRVANEHSGRIGLLLTDVVMPGMNGADLAQRLQCLQPDLITIFMSGYAHRDVVQKIAQRAAIHIQKPFTIDVLLSRIAEALQTEESEQTGALPRLAV